MANFIHFLIGVISALTFISLLNVNSAPTDTTPVAILVDPIVETIVNKPRECSKDADCNDHEHCLNGSICACNRGWATHVNINDSISYCSYQQRSKQKAFFLSLFSGVFGIDWFYLSRGDFGYIIAGILKLLLAFGCCGSWLLTYFGPELQNSESVKSKLRGVSTCFSLLAFAWWIVDWLRILGNRFPDGRGAGLTPW